MPPSDDLETRTIEFSYSKTFRDPELVAMGLINQVFRQIEIEGFAAKRVANWVKERFGGQDAA